ncbi:hypothetical protein F4804DRAFT_200534 [Jackrogersella minutella]|nr:hypothetical protein F4804DRAFT_200534 [Jackrogersella minutella]
MRPIKLVILVIAVSFVHTNGTTNLCISQRTGINFLYLSKHLYKMHCIYVDKVRHDTGMRTRMKLAEARPTYRNTQYRNRQQYYVPLIFNHLTHLWECIVQYVRKRQES